MQKIKSVLRNYYVISSLTLLFWMIFFDSSNLIGVYSLKSKISDLEDQKEYYQERIVEVQKTKDELFSNPESLEKFARERYLMKKERGRLNSRMSSSTTLLNRMCKSLRVST